MKTLTDKQVREFIEITKRAFGKDLTMAEARAIATRFLLCLERLNVARTATEQLEKQPTEDHAF